MFNAGQGADSLMQSLPASAVVEYRQTDDIVGDARLIIESSQRWAHRSVNAALVYRNWYLGKRIAEEELKGESRAEYGAQVIVGLAKALTKEYGKGYSKLNLWYFVRFYKAYPSIVYAASKQSAPLIQRKPGKTPPALGSPPIGEPANLYHRMLFLATGI